MINGTSNRKLVPNAQLSMNFPENSVSYSSSPRGTCISFPRLDMQHLSGGMFCARDRCRPPDLHAKPG
ncbi:hypothetical protein HBI46_227190 [Parastagonospora nodorum]|nr:hypothetical protein HBI46_227190 [Parastagonospora nodorum]